MYQVDIRVPTADLPGTVAAQFQDVSRVTIDRITGIGMQHKLKLVNAHDVQIGSISTDGTTNVVRWMVARDTKSSLRIADSVGGLLRFGAAPQTEPRHTPVPPPTTVIDATAFGVIPDDGLDDTAALQAAIDSLPRGNGIPGSGDLVGGIVQLPLGAINTSQPIKLPSGVWLRGHNNGTVIRNTTTSAGRGIIEFTSPYAHRSNIGAGLVELGLYSTAAAGIRADSTISGELRDLRLVGLKMRTAGPAIDLRSEQVNHALLDRIVVTDAGTIVIGLGRDDNSSVGNHVRGVRITGRLR
ncbi:MAG: glycoside hydrolase family 55 protein, partial [Gemmatimonadetes bacterium]|nr:glycoside hydrolase family 55 protein [Gemmatimonadota bacterium]